MVLIGIFLRPTGEKSETWLNAFQMIPPPPYIFTFIGATVHTDGTCNRQTKIKH